MIIEINVSNKIARLKDKNAVAVCDNSDYVIRFNFDQEWSAYDAKTARFKYNGSYTDVVFTGIDCNMPVINNTFSVEIGVFAGELHTTTAAYLPMKKSILRDSGTPVSPTPSVYEQIIALLNSKANGNQGIENVGKFWKVGADGELVFGTSVGAAWNDIANKPFETIGDGLKIVGTELQVDTANAVEQDNTKPVTSAAVHVEIGNIEALLAAL